MVSSKKSSTFAATDSTTLPVEQRTRVERLLYIHMEYIKKPLTIPEQIELLKGRGLLIQDEEKAQDALLKISYFRLAAYLRPMEQDKQQHIFKTNSYFENAVSLYDFDKDLRTLLFSVIQSIEIAFRSALINTVACEHGSFWFMRPELFGNIFFERNITKIKQEVERSPEEFIKEYYEKYDAPSLPPVWKTFEVVSFGSLSKMYSLLNDKPLKKQIARDFGLPKYVYLENWLLAIVVLRNCIAHHARLWNRNLPFLLRLPDRINLPWIKTEEVNTTKLFAILSCIYYLLRIVEPNNHFREDLLALFAAYPNVDLRAMGFPENWREFPLWK